MDEGNAQGMCICESNAPKVCDSSKKFGLFPSEFLRNLLGEEMEETGSTVENDFWLVSDK